MNDLPAQVLAIVRSECDWFGTLSELTPDTVLDARWFGPVDRCCVAIELSEQFNAEIPDAEIDKWERAEDIIASVKRLVGALA